MVLFDKGNIILKSLEFKKDPQEWMYQLRNAATAPDRLDAARALAEIKNNEDVAAALGEAARSDRFWAVRSESLRALGRIGGPAAQKQILAALGEPQPWVRSVAVGLLGGFKDEPSVAATLDKILREDRAYGVRGAALRSLAQQKAPNAFDALRAAAGMDSPDERIRSAALSAMGALGDDRAVPLLLEWSAPGKPISVRSPGIASLGRVAKQDKEVMKKLISYLDEPYQFIRFAAVLALAERGDPDAIAPLEKLAKDSNVSGGMSNFIQSQIARLKPKPAGAQPGAAGGEAAKGSAQVGAAEPSNQQILQAIEKLQKDLSEIKERLKKLEERVADKK
jgi:HEAT repeat protein